MGKENLPPSGQAIHTLKTLFEKGAIPEETYNRSLHNLQTITTPKKEVPQEVKEKKVEDSFTLPDGVTKLGTPRELDVMHVLLDSYKADEDLPQSKWAWSIWGKEGVSLEEAAEEDINRALSNLAQIKGVLGHILYRTNWEIKNVKKRKESGEPRYRLISKTEEIPQTRTAIDTATQPSQPTTQPTEKQHASAISQEQRSAPKPFEAPSKAIAPTSDMIALAERVTRIVPEQHLKFWLGIEGMKPEEYTRQIIEFSRKALEAKKSTEVTYDTLMSTSNQEKRDVIQSYILQHLLPLLNADTKELRSKSTREWDSAMQKLLDFSGHDSKRAVAESFNNLPDLGRALAIAASSMTFLIKLEFIDIDECDERQFGTYIRRAANELNRPSVQDDTLEMLITTAIERNDLDHGAIIDVIMSQAGDNSDRIFNKIMTSGQFGEFRDALRVFFLSNPQTHYLGRQISEHLSEGEPSTKLPWHRVSDQMRIDQNELSESSSDKLINGDGTDHDI